MFYNSPRCNICVQFAWCHRQWSDRRLGSRLDKRVCRPRALSLPRTASAAVVRALTLNNAVRAVSYVSCLHSSSLLTPRIVARLLLPRRRSRCQLRSSAPAAQREMQSIWTARVAEAQPVASSESKESAEPRCLPLVEYLVRAPSEREGSSGGGRGASDLSHAPSAPCCLFQLTVSPHALYHATNLYTKAARSDAPRQSGSGGDKPLRVVCSFSPLLSRFHNRVLAGKGILVYPDTQLHHLLILVPASMHNEQGMQVRLSACSRVLLDRIQLS